jgi:hypothetical protein
MILYTSMPQELIFQTPTEEYTKQSVINYQGVQLLVEQSGAAECRVLRVMSTDPAHYLDSNYTPGTMITMTPSFG